jgi:hypothetical protein
MGNESGMGANLHEALRWTKEYDRTRLTHYERASFPPPGEEINHDNLDLYSSMYPSIEEIDRYFDGTVEDVIAFAAYPGEESNIRALASQEKFNPAIVLNASIGKTWYVGGNQIGFSLEIKNLTNTICKTGGFEQMRLFSDDEYETTTGTRYSRFDSKYFYLYGTNYYLNIYFRF